MAKNPGEDYYNYAVNKGFSVGRNSRDASVFHFGDRVLVEFYDGDLAYGHMASHYRDKAHKYIRLSPGAALVKPNSVSRSRGLTFKTAIVTHVQHI